MYTQDFVEETSEVFGKVVANVPEHIIVGSDIELQVLYVPSREGLAAGSKIRVTLPPGFHSVQDENRNEPGFVEAEFEGAHELIVRKELNFGLLLTEGCQPQQTIKLTYNPAGQCSKLVAAQVCYKDPVEFAVDVMPEGEGIYRRIFSEEIRLVPEKPERIFIKIPSVVYENETFDLDINIRDKFDNIAEAFTGEVVLSGNREVLEFPERVTFTLEDKGSKCIKKCCRFITGRCPDSEEEILLQQPLAYAMIPAPKELVNLQKISAACGELAGQSNYVMLSEEGTPRIYWGEFHVHTRELSDGMGTVNDAFYYMKQVSKFDFGALNDHSFQGGHPFLPETPRGDCHISKEAWVQLIRRCTAESEQGRFVAVPGYEWSGRADNPELTKGWAGKVVSDKNILFGNYDPSNPIIYQIIGPLGESIGVEERATIPEELYRKLEGTDYLAVSHSPSSRPMGTDFSHVDDTKEPVVEIYSMHGANEYYGNPRPLYTVLREGFIQDALAAGKKLGFIAGGDDHHTHPGSRKVTRLDYVPMAYLRYRPGITAIMAEQLTIGSLFNSIRARSCYATTGERILLRFGLDGSNQMGQCTEVVNAPVFHCLAAGTDRIMKMELVRNNEVIFCWTGTYEVEKFAYKDEGIQPGESFYYLRITQQNGEMAWSSPIWLNYR